MSHVMVARWRPCPGETGKVVAILRELAAAVRREPGNRQFTVLQAREDPDEFLLYEVYASEAAFADHRQTDHFKKLVLEGAVPLLEVRELRAYAVVDEI